MIDVSKIPAADARVLSSTMLDAVMRFYATPENQRRYEMWKKKRDENDGGKKDD